jgi:hypothetical protein
MTRCCWDWPDSLDEADRGGLDGRERVQRTRPVYIFPTLTARDKVGVLLSCFLCNCVQSNGMEVFKAERSLSDMLADLWQPDNSTIVWSCALVVSMFGGLAPLCYTTTSPSSDRELIQTLGRRVCDRDETHRFVAEITIGGWSPRHPRFFDT